MRALARTGARNQSLGELRMKSLVATISPVVLTVFATSLFAAEIPSIRQRADFVCRLFVAKVTPV
jgi:hypothetical protein